MPKGTIESEGFRSGSPASGRPVAQRPRQARGARRGIANDHGWAAVGRLPAQCRESAAIVAKWVRAGSPPQWSDGEIGGLFAFVARPYNAVRWLVPGRVTRRQARDATRGERIYAVSADRPTFQG